MKGTSGMAKDVVKAFINSKMVINMKAIGIMTNVMVKVNLHGVLGILMKENGRTISCTVLVILELKKYRWNMEN